jgi:hypothetical protein
MGLVAKRVTDKRILKLIRGFLTAGALIDGLVGPTEEGTPQGGPLSPLLSNLMLDVLDKELEKRGHHFVRYADDCVPRTHRRKEVRNCVRDGGRSSGAGRQGQASNHRKLRRLKAGVVSVAEKAGLDPVRYGSERRARANR